MLHAVILYVSVDGISIAWWATAAVWGMVSSCALDIAGSNLATSQQPLSERDEHFAISCRCASSCFMINRWVYIKQMDVADYYIQNNVNNNISSTHTIHYMSPHRVR